MLYSDKMQSVNAAYETVLNALYGPMGIRATHYPEKKVCHIEVMDISEGDVE